MKNSASAQQSNTKGNSPWLSRTYSAVLSFFAARLPRVDSPEAVIPQPTFPQYNERRLFQPDLDELNPLQMLLQSVVRGEEEEADGLLTTHPELLLKRGTITDDSGRTFKNTSAYEYAYWAYDKDMCRMLERHMDANTATIIHERCLDIDKNGLTYEQRGVVIEHSCHFDLTPLKSALQKYVNGHDHWVATQNMTARVAAWMAVGRAQRDVTVYVANMYCRFVRATLPMDVANKDILPRNLKFYDREGGRAKSWFPLVDSASSGLGINYAIIRFTTSAMALDVPHAVEFPRRDLEAVSHLDEAITNELTQSRENLALIGRELGIGPMV